MHLAEVNIARLRAPLDGPGMGGLVKALDDVFWLAERSPGFVWRLKPDDGGPLVYREVPGCGPGPVVVTLSVWETFEALRQYVYRTAHGLFMQQRRRWFVPVGGFTTALWWVDEGSHPPIDDALGRLVRLRTSGPSPDAFSLGMTFDAEGTRQGRSE